MARNFLNEYLNPFSKRPGQPIEVRKRRATEQQGICVFVSHSKKDKDHARRIVDYLIDNDVDVYFDENDKRLQQALEITDNDNDRAVALCIQDGLNNSTHALCIVSLNSLRSQWVPYEIGYSAHMGNPLALLRLKEVTSVPSFYSLADTVISNIFDLDRYIIGLKGTVKRGRESYRYRGVRHPLLDSMDEIGSVRYY